MFEVQWSSTTQDFFLEDGGENWIDNFCRRSPYQTGEGRINSPAMQGLKQFLPLIRQGQLKTYNQVNIFFAAGNFVARAEHNFADVPKPVGGEIIISLEDRDTYIRKNMPKAYLDRHEQEIQLLELE